MSDQPERKQVNFSIVPDEQPGEPRTYANFCSIAHTPFDFTLTFCEVMPLSGSIPVVAPHGGVIVFAVEPGAHVHQGDTIAELIDPLSGEVTVLGSPVDGLMFARDNRRFAVAGMPIAKVAGREALRQGKLLSA